MKSSRAPSGEARTRSKHQRSHERKLAKCHHCLLLLALVAIATASRLVAVSCESVAPASTSQPGSKLELEEVDLLKQRRPAHVYYLRAARFNGRLQLPARLEKSAAPETGGFGARAAGLRQSGPAPALSSSSSSSSLSSPAPSSSVDYAPESGAVAPPAADCSQEAGAGIAASSPMLRLLPARNATGQRLAAGRKQPASASSGEVDESESEQVTATISERASGSSPAPAAASSASSSADSILTLIDEYDFKIVTNRTRALLSCDSGEMILRLNFSEPFKGIVYPDHNRLSPCRFFGDGHHNYELRLPLRGCGTRQAAPRIFVNDVIVRFHKTLELEEDEAKTLICRYPPPLAAESTSADFSRTPTRNNQIEFETGNAFEFIDSSTGRQRTQNSLLEPGTTGNIETLSDNLVVGPNGRQQLTNVDSMFGIPSNLNAHSRSSTANNNNNRLFGQQASGKLRDHPDSFKQRNSLVQDPSEPILGPMNSINQQQRAGFFDRLTSIELLFLISSLMFLVLLALGLAGSYYCFRRQARHTRSNQQVSAILRRKRRFPPGAGVAGVAHSQRTPRHHGAYAGAATNAGLAYPLPAPHIRLAANQTLPPQSSSSPESDVSNRGLLSGYQPKLAGAGLGGAAAAGAYSSGGYHADLPPLQQHYLEPASSGQYTLNSQRAYGAPKQPPAVAPSGVGRKAPVLPASIPVMGRREATYGYGYTPSLSRPQHQRHLAVGQLQQSPALINQRPMDLSRRQRRQRAPEASTASVPLGETAAEYSRTLRRLNQQQQVEGYGATQRPQLWRAKSLASVDPNETSGGSRAAYLLGAQQTGLLGGTLKRDGASRRHERPHHHSSHQRLLERNNPFRSSEFVDFFGNGAKGRDEATGSLSDSGEETSRLFGLSGDRLGVAHERRQKQRPRIVLKSIEDSYITNFTEIYEQDYKARDETKPLAFDEWRKLQPTTGGNKQRAANDQMSPATTSTSSDNEDAAGANERADESKFTSHNLRSLTELDVNDFAKLTPEPPTSPGEQPSSVWRAPMAGRSPISPLRQASSAERLLDVTIDSDSGPQPRARSTSSDPETKTRSRTRTEAAAAATAHSDSDEGDFVLSPDYECRPAAAVKGGPGGAAAETPPAGAGPAPRLALSKSPDSHNSVSYV